MSIHPRTEIDPSAVIADDATVGPGVVIGPNSVIEAGAEIGPNVILGPNTTIREAARIFPGAVIGTEPQDFKYDGSPTKCEIGRRSIIREYCTINRGTKASGATIIGQDCMLMSYTHVAHDCRIGDHVIMASGTALGGHVHVGDGAIIGGNAGIHQFVRIGTLAMIGGASGLRQDAPPYMITAGAPPAVVYAVNMIGLRRNGISPESRALIKEAFRILYRSGLNKKLALAKIDNELEKTKEIEHLLEFFRTSRRGVARGHQETPVTEIEV
jgi:UDP-N-acetylglucosamine acyltransferase